MNHCTFIGRVSTDPQYGTTEKTTYLRFNLAVDRQGTDGVDFLRCIIWGRLADTMNKFLKKGRLIFIAGRLQSSQYIDKETTKKITDWSLHGSTIELLDRPSRDNGDLQQPEEEPGPWA